MTSATDFSAVHPEFAPFAAVFERELRPELEALEAKRRAAWARFLRWGLFCLLAAAVTAGIGAVLGWPRAVWFGFGGAGVLGVVALAMLGPLDGLTAKAKRLVLDAICAQLGLDYHAETGPPSALTRLQTYSLAPRYDRAAFFDALSGQRRGVRFTLTGAQLEERRVETRVVNGRVKTEVRWVTVFLGQILRLDYPHAFEGVTVLARDAGWFNAGSLAGGLKSVGFADPDFEKTFEVYASDQVAARALFDPMVQERFKALDALFKNAQLRGVFDDGALTLALQNDGRLELGDLKSGLAGPQAAAGVLKEIALVFDMIDLTTKRIDAILSGAVTIEAVRNAQPEGSGAPE
ncbi:MAG: DUF3137 domain-containing protein [Maricaulaceae bacterium]